MSMQHYVLFLQGFAYDIRYRKSEEHANADGFSRLPVGNGAHELDIVDVLELNISKRLPVM